MAVRAKKNGIEVTFTCAQWAGFPVGKYGWTELENTCASVLDNLHTPFAYSGIITETGIAGTPEPKSATIDGSAIVAREIPLGIISGATVTSGKRLGIYEQGKKLLEGLEYNLNLTSYKAILTFDPIEFSKYELVYQP